MPMWDDFIQCFRKGSKIKGCTETKISELFNRVPPDQRKQLQLFAKKHDEYRQRVRKYPDKMPAIDWNYYKTNVRKEMVAWVHDYEKKYDNLDSLFANRHTMIDLSKYFGELSTQTEQVKKEVKKFKDESEKRIKILQGKMKELECMRPYTEMTMEEFCVAHPNEAPDFRNKPTFWPHTPEEQVPDVEHVHEESDSAAKKPSAGDKPDPSKTPPKAPPSGGAAPKDAKPETPPKTKEGEPKEAKASDPNKKAVDPPKEAEKAQVSAVKVEEKESMESQITEKVTELASKGIDVAKDLGIRAFVLLKNLWEKVENKRREVAETAKAERMKNESSAAAVKTVSSKVRDGSSDICNKTIIRGEDTAKADVKEHHVDLNIEGESDADVCKEKAKEEEKEPKKCKKDVATICFQKYQEEKKDGRLSAAERESCADAVKEESNSFTANQCVDVCQEKPQDDDKKCKPDEKAYLPDKPKLQAELPKPLPTCELKQTPTTSAMTSPALKLKSSSAAGDDTIIGMHQEVLTAENEIFLGTKKMPMVLKDSKQPDKVKPDQVKELTQQLKGEKVPVDKVLQVAELAVLGKSQQQTDIPPVTIKSEQKNQGKDEAKSIPAAAKQDVKQPDNNEDSDEIAKVMFKMAIGAAQLLSEAKKNIEQAQRENAGQAEALQEAFEMAEKQVNVALSKAYSALASAKKLTHRAQTTLEADEQKMVATIEKHSVLAKLLANRAITMQKEIAKLLAGLKKKL